MYDVSENAAIHMALSSVFFFLLRKTLISSPRKFIVIRFSPSSVRVRKSGEKNSKKKQHRNIIVTARFPRRSCPQSRRRMCVCVCAVRVHEIIILIIINTVNILTIAFPVYRRHRRRRLIYYYNAYGRDGFWILRESRL